MGSQFLNFNVAGHRFTTSKDTILKEPASRLALIARYGRGTEEMSTAAAALLFMAKHSRLSHMCVHSSQQHTADKLQDSATV